MESRTIGRVDVFVLLLMPHRHSECPTGIRLILSFHPTAVFWTHSVMVDVGTTIVILLLLLTIN